MSQPPAARPHGGLLEPVFFQLHPRDHERTRLSVPDRRQPLDQDALVEGLLDRQVVDAGMYSRIRR